MGLEVRGAGLSTPPAFEEEERRLLQACVGFHAKAQTDPVIRDRLHRLWCKLDALVCPSAPTD